MKVSGLFPRAAFVLPLLLIPLSATATTRQWTGASNNVWNNSNNWSPNGVPANGDDLEFPSGALNTSVQNNMSGLSLHSIIFSDTGYNIFGNDISLSSGISEYSNFAFFLSSQTNTIQLNIALTANQTFHVESRVVGMILVSDTVTVSGNVTGPFNLIKDGGGVLLLSGTTNAYSGSTTISEGTLRLGNGTAIPPTSAVTLAFAAAPNTAALDVNGFSASIGSLNGPSGTFVRLGTGGTLQVGDFGYATFGGVVSGTGGTLRVSGGGGALTLSGNNTYTGPTLVEARTVVTGSQPQSPVTASATIAGTGTVGDVTLNVNGILNAGTDFGLPGSIHVGALTMNAGTAFVVDLNGTTPGTGYDQVVATGNVGFNNTSGALSVYVGMAFTPAAGTSFTILDKQSVGAINSTFVNLPQGGGLVASGIEFKITYVGGDGNDVVLTVVSPPSVTISSGSTVLCSGGSLVLTANPTNGTGSYSYQWKKDTFDVGGANSPTFDAGGVGGGIGSYTVVVTDSANVMATSPGFMVVADATGPTVTAPAASTATQSLCN
ncbi:MAG TPA: autotransporter-associated beta strand repeat-containing protein [Thermoanaerobaculia bacterium]|nr:autotransporter-associated beta strand repeat-containing protein [Thermoanaerobaculia bacterium]